MNGYLLLLPILVLSLGFSQNAFGIVGYNFFNTANPDGSNTFETHEPYVFNGTNWVPFIATGNTVQTDLATVTLNADGTFEWNGKFTDKIVAKYADVTNLNVWTYPATLNNDVPDISWDGSQFTSSKIKSGVGQLDYKYILINGKWKTQLEATNLSALNTKAFGFDQIVDLNSDTIKFGGVTRNLDNFNGVTFDKNFLDNNKANVLEFLNGVNFDFDLDYENLYSVTIHDTGVNKSQLVFDYRTSIPLLPGQTLIIDPTFTSATGTEYQIKTGAPAATTACPTTATTTVSGSDQLYLEPSGSTSNYCSVIVLDFSTPGFTSPVTITNSSLTFFLATIGNGRNCDINEVLHNPLTSSATTMWNDALNTANGTTYLDNNAWCITTGSKDLDLGAGADSAFTSLLNGGALNLYLSFVYDSMTRDASYHEIQGLSVEKLTLTYTNSSSSSPPNPVTVLSANSITTNSLNLEWDPPTSFGTGTFQTYTINYSKPWGTPTTFLANTTSLFYNVTGLTFGTDYSYRVAARTTVPGNTTGNTILDVTTLDGNTYSLPPTSLTVSPHGSSSQLDLQWVASAMQNINGYKIQRETPIGTGFATIVSNTTNANIFYNNTGLSTNIIYNYRVYALNGSGVSTASNEYDMTTFHLPDAVDDLSATATDFSTVALSWTAPTSYAPEIIGYRVNYTTPTGTPQTIQTPDPYTTTVDAIMYDLTTGADYSFRVAPVTIHGTNASGNIFNATTANLFPLGNLTTGYTTNTDDFKIFFTRTDNNATTVTLDVTYPNTYNLSCDFAYQLARTNQTYSGLTSTAVDADNVESSFVFINATGDIIHVICWDRITGDEARYVLTITEFPFLDQISNLRNGTYGTYFQVGVIDGVTLMICILAMIGFNRTNPIAGMIFLVITIGVLSWFEIIEYPIIMYPALALLMVWGYVSTRKDD